MVVLWVEGRVDNNNNTQQSLDNTYSNMLNVSDWINPVNHDNYHSNNRGYDDDEMSVVVHAVVGLFDDWYYD